MATTIQLPQPMDVSTPLGALVTHFNSSSKSVQRAFAKMITSVLEQERQAKLQAKIDTGISDIKNGKGISRKTGESTVQFFERLCTE